MLLKIFFALVVVVAAMSYYINSQPTEFSLAREVSISAPSAAVFPHVNDFHLWEQWSPWAKIDPGSKTTFEGPAAGEGAIYHWSGNSKVGEGKMTILKAVAPNSILISLEFLRPVKSTSITIFEFKRTDVGTQVIWTMTGTNKFIAKAFQLVMNMEKMLGPDFEKGLAQLKAVVEGAKK